MHLSLALIIQCRHCSITLDKANRLPMVLIMDIHIWLSLFGSLHCQSANMVSWMEFMLCLSIERSLRLNYLWRYRKSSIKCCGAYSEVDFLMRCLLESGAYSKTKGFRQKCLITAESMLRKTINSRRKTKSRRRHGEEFSKELQNRIRGHHVWNRILDKNSWASRLKCKLDAWKWGKSDLF